MGINRNVGTLEELAAGLSHEERQELLRRILESAEVSSAAVINKNHDGEKLKKQPNYKMENVFYRFILWIRSVFTGIKQDKLYNSDLISNLGASVMARYPSLISMKSKEVLFPFYKKLCVLKSAADFFRKYTSLINDNPGRYYVFLSTLVSPGIVRKMDEEVDPYLLPLDSELTSETRYSRVKKMEIFLKNISDEDKEELYSAAKSIIWLKKFVELPLEHIIDKFILVANDEYTCSFYVMREYYKEFAAHLQYPVSIDARVFESLFLFSLRKGSVSIELNEKTETAMKAFLKEAFSYAAAIASFIENVPLLTLGKIIFEDYSWNVEETGGGEDWFLKFKDQWKAIFDQQWNSWLKARKKKEMEARLAAAFSIDDFPSLPFSPWKTLWGGLHFSVELSARLLLWLVTKQNPVFQEILNKLSLEGIFQKKKTKEEFAAVLHEFDSLNAKISSFSRNLSPNGEIGSIFRRAKEAQVRTINLQSSIDSTIMTMENNVRTWVKSMCENYKLCLGILAAILGKNDEKGYRGLENFDNFDGVNHENYIKELEDTYEKIKTAFELLAETEVLDIK